MCELKVLFLLTFIVWVYVCLIGISKFSAYFVPFVTMETNPFLAIRESESSFGPMANGELLDMLHIPMGNCFMWHWGKLFHETNANGVWNPLFIRI